MTDALCWTTRLSLATLEAEQRLSGARGAHAASCLRCQADAARHRRLARGLADLVSVVTPAPVGFAASVLEAIEHDVALSTPGSRTRGVAAAGAAAVVAAGTVVVLRRMRGAA